MNECSKSVECRLIFLKNQRTRTAEDESVITYKNLVNIDANYQEINIYKHHSGFGREWVRAGELCC